MFFLDFLDLHFIELNYTLTPSNFQFLSASDEKNIISNYNWANAHRNGWLCQYSFPSLTGLWSLATSITVQTCLRLWGQCSEHYLLLIYLFYLLFHTDLKHNSFSNPVCKLNQFDDAGGTLEWLYAISCPSSQRLSRRFMGYDPRFTG